MAIYVKNIQCFLGESFVGVSFVILRQTLSMRSHSLIRPKSFKWTKKFHLKGEASYRTFNSICL